VAVQLLQRAQQSDLQNGSSSRRHDETEDGDTSE
jgi:hypothetical protein